MNIFEGLIASYKDAGAYTSRAIAKLLASVVAFHVTMASVFLLYFVGSFGPDISPLTPLVLYPMVYFVVFNLLSVGSNHATPGQRVELYFVLFIVGVMSFLLGSLLYYGQALWTWTAAMFSFGFIALHGFQMLKLFMLAAFRHRELRQHYAMSGFDHVQIADKDEEYTHALRGGDRRQTPLIR